MTASDSPVSADALRADDLAYVWHPYTAHDRRTGQPPLPVVMAAQGMWLTLDDGSRLMDATGSWWVSNLGHRPPRVVEALHRQLDVNPHSILADVTHPGAATLARRLAEVAPAGLTRTFYTDNGSTAVEVAIQAAVQYWQQQGQPDRTLFLTFDAAYHGDTMAALSVGGIGFFRRRFERLTFETIRIPSPGAGSDDDAPTAAPERALDALAEVLREHGSRVAGLIVEPLIQGAGGMLMYPPAWLTRLRELCDAWDVLLIADEVFTGFGRTLRMFACEHAGITPDFLCLSKGLTGGTLPFGATMTTARIYHGFDGGIDRALLYGHSYCGNPLGCAAALAVLDTFATDHVLENASARAEQLRMGLEPLRSLDGVHDIRQTGLVAAIQLGAKAAYSPDTGRRLVERLQARGIFMRPLGNVVYAVPALTIAADELQLLLDTLSDTLRTALHDLR
jgi:adenosylmethionine-8-amino-7-oxononanoate aminotransferase